MGFDEEEQHTLQLLAMLLKPEKVQRGQVLLKQGEKHQEVLLVNSKTHLRVLRKVTLDGGRQRVVELQPLRGPCLLNERCLSTEGMTCASTILVSNPGIKSCELDHALLAPALRSRLYFRADDV